MGWRPLALLSRDPQWRGADKAGWVEIAGDGPGKPETPTSDSLLDANRVIVSDLIHAVESDTQPRASVYDARAAIEMILGCYASHVRRGMVSLPLSDRARHPLVGI